MGLIGSGLSFILKLANDGVNVSFWTLSSWLQSFMTSLYTWEIRADNGKDGKRSSLGCVEASREVLFCRRTLFSPTGAFSNGVLALFCVAFKSSKALASHQARSHHKERLSGRYVKDGNCPFCGAFFHTRRRAMHHVDFGCKACKIQLLSSLGLPELTEDEIALARQQDRLDYAATKARSVWRNAGPPACPPLGGWTRPKQ